MNDRVKANKLLEDSGRVLLPKYWSRVNNVLGVPVLIPKIVSMAKGKRNCKLSYTKKRQANKFLASDMLDIAAYVYGRGGDTVAGYNKLDKMELPYELQVLYNEHTGILTGTGGLKVWLGKRNNKFSLFVNMLLLPARLKIWISKRNSAIVVSYSGTNPMNLRMIQADFEQLSVPSVLYLKSAGLLRLLLNHMPNKFFYVTGHSLGGGLMQFSVTANINKRLHGYGFNSAGLSSTSLVHLHENRLNEAKTSIWIFNTCNDIVSFFGGQIGCVTVLPRTDKNGHDIKDLKECMYSYLGARKFAWILMK